jgi:hypothetical protein
MLGNSSRSFSLKAMLKGISEKSGRDIQRKVIKIFLSVSEKFSGIGDGEKAWLNI